MCASLHSARESRLTIPFFPTDGAQSFFPVYEPTQEDLKARLKAAEGPADTKHYDANQEGKSPFDKHSEL